MPTEKAPASVAAINIVRNFVSFPETPSVLPALTIIGKREGKNHVDTVFRRIENTVHTGYLQISTPVILVVG
jgi:hypothetical protein